MRIIAYELFIIIALLDIKALEIIWKAPVPVCELFPVPPGRSSEEHWSPLVHTLVLLYHTGITG